VCVYIYVLTHKQEEKETYTALLAGVEVEQEKSISSVRGIYQKKPPERTLTRGKEQCKAMGYPEDALCKMGVTLTPC
jgi:hypothetical protein